MNTGEMIRKNFLIVLILIMSYSAASGADVLCEKDVAFQKWLSGVKNEALAHGVSDSTWNSALPYLIFDPSIVRRDQAQSVFQQSFLQFSDRMASLARQKKGLQLINVIHKDLFGRVEAEFGVPPQPIVAFWALESDYGAFTGNFSVLKSVTTLAYDCRRPELFRPQVIASLKLLERGDFKPDEFKGAWAGELGATQFMPADYLEFGMDYDNDGRVDLLRSVPDIVASAANFLRAHGWKAGESWLQEVVVPAEMPWEQADLEIQLPVSTWTKLGRSGE
jgi:lytic murein transglycosylase